MNYITLTKSHKFCKIDSIPSSILTIFLFFNFTKSKFKFVPFKWNFHWYFFPSDVWGPGKPPAERCALVPFLSPFLFFFACPVCASSPLLRYLSLVLVFFFFFFGFPSCARLDSRQLGARHVLYALEKKLGDFRNSWTFLVSFRLSALIAFAKEKDGRSLRF